MHITHSYKGSIQGKFRYSFFLLYEDYIQAQSGFVREIDLLLERFARNLGDEGVVIRPFLGDIENTRNHIMDKQWTENEKKQLRNTPGFLVIDKDFDIFCPRKHEWMYLNFGGQMYDSSITVAQYEDILTSLVDIVANPENDFFKEALPVVRKLKLESAGEVFEAKPGVFGFSIDLKEAASVLRSMFE